MTQDELNAAEWSNPENWSSPTWIGLYFSKQDTRAWVPKPIPTLGWTVNLAHPRGVYWAMGLLSVAVLVAALAGYFAATLA